MTTDEQFNALLRMMDNLASNVRALKNRVDLLEKAILELSEND